jgi:thiol-disulfide isomerase/thioredoxin
MSSTMLPLGTRLPQFSLTDTVTGASVTSDALGGAVAVIAILCNHCPFVKHVQGGLAELAREYLDRGVRIVGVSPNDVDAYPQDGPREMAEEARRAGYVFPYCFDETQALAQALQAVCTPEFYVFDPGGALVYRGQMDDSRPENGVPVTGRDLRAALDAVLSGQRPDLEQRPSIGCSIKWKPENQPS